jgi:hypothetical protein
MTTLRQLRPHLVGAMSALQLIEAIVSATAPTATRARLDRLDVPPWIRSSLPAIKITMSAGLLLGMRWPRVGAAAAGAMVAFYATATSFHRLSDDPIILALPAALFGAGAAGCLLNAGHDSGPVQAGPSFGCPSS